MQSALKCFDHLPALLSALNEEMNDASWLLECLERKKLRGGTVKNKTIGRGPTGVAALRLAMIEIFGVSCLLHIRLTSWEPQVGIGHEWSANSVGR